MTTELEQQVENLSARVALLEQENLYLKSTMIAAAEEIHAHWQAHCDKDGYGPVNLMRRLERGIPSKYSYTAGDFARLEAKIAKMSEYISVLMNQLYKVPPEHQHVEAKYVLAEVQNELYNKENSQFHFGVMNNGT